ncbi:LacI family DNA-binding transcriptional regulator [Microbulbifer bruguierae]|uniref:LacI family DNA-binding transcriptional regulator n=1 Tax=Microbulbifer bruguierae TaxID=3029061 RepID=A0ABY8NLA0_9GAMM|nr:LacI family DNA-binding transcriptional regulator [Microbulbifer bruguierae]WGL18393.1 LacI family DNA-binding transcriptional regulator [Microbulbifer bruguierae]
MSNIRTVARLAGVSVATVSRTLAKPDLVSPRTRKKVLAAVDEAGYKPNLMAVQFRSRRTHNLVVLVPTIANPFFSRVITGIQERAREAGYQVLLCNTLGREEIERDYARMVQNFQADGVIQLRAFDPFSGLDEAEKGEGKVKGKGKVRGKAGDQLPPMVNACEVMRDCGYPSVQLNNRAAARAITDHLVRLGHRRIGLIKGPQRSPLTLERVAGYREALEAAGIAFDDSLLCPGDFTLQSGHRAAGTLITRDNPPTAIFCENDEMALGAMQRIKQAGLRVPQDISVAGFDDIAYASYSDPALTTIAQPAEEFGATAAQLLIDQLETASSGEPAQVVLPYDLKVRDSTGPAP